MQWPRKHFLQTACYHLYQLSVSHRTVYYYTVATKRYTFVIHMIAEDGHPESPEPLSSSKDKLRAITQHLMDEACTHCYIRSAINNHVHAKYNYTKWWIYNRFDVFLHGWNIHIILHAVVDYADLLEFYETLTSLLYCTGIGVSMWK